MERPVDQPKDAIASEAPPPGYEVVMEQALEGEGCKPFACPRLSCDGFTFDTIQECQSHEEDWHNPPYLCSECDRSFAAKPALKRHFAMSGHFDWISSTLYQQAFYSKGEFGRHGESHGHSHAVQHSEMLRESGKSIAAITAEQEAAREFRCTAEGCPYFGEKLKTSRSFYRHIKTPHHLSPPCRAAPDPTSPTAEMRHKFSQLSLACDEPECPKYEHQFFNKGNLAKHTRSLAHLKAVSYGRMKRSTADAASQFKSEPAARTPERQAQQPSTPAVWTPFSFSPMTAPATANGRRVVEAPKAVTPTKRPMQSVSLLTPPSSWREEKLRKRNRELEDELEQMKDKVERMRTAFKEQISSLFQTLGEKQGRDWL
ncbi:hypothetical protein Trco_008031 [Trichoderma cornu-damae]|uniref:C2H2-type domain-containing protein n=1 Tax=Trichoderma cornu-damae TaxID=654480 RepID=A0A9P8QEZ5_9HYPO|nr:hypothetical protein Trco_008031 [Trichoderma cornu-damae]